MTYLSDQLRASLHVIRQCCGHTYEDDVRKAADEIDRLTALVAAKPVETAPPSPRRPWMDTLYGGDDDGSPVKRDRDLAAYCDALAARIATLEAVPEDLPAPPWKAGKIGEWAYVMNQFTGVDEWLQIAATSVDANSLERLTVRDGRGFFRRIPNDQVIRVSTEPFPP